MVKIQVFHESVSVCCPECGQNFRADKKAGIIYPQVVCTDGKIRSWSEASKREGFCAYCKAHDTTTTQRLKLTGMGHRQVKMLHFLQSCGTWQTLAKDAHTQQVARSLVKRGLIEINGFSQAKVIRELEK